MEADWNTCTNPQRMLEVVREKASDRKLRLFAVGWCRSIWRHIHPEIRRQAVEAAEKYADGEIDNESFLTVREPVFRMRAECSLNKATEKAISAVTWALDDRPAERVVGMTAFLTQESWFRGKDQRLVRRVDWQQINRRLVECVFGNHFGPVALDPAWPTFTVQQLAAGIYEERAFDRMPILGDALEEAGCTNAGILNHCRQPGVHVRGCWVVDLLLGKE